MTTIKSVLFDLDDTLYDEMDFVSAALQRVAEFLSSRTGTPASSFHGELLHVLHHQGRGRVFDTVLDRHSLPLSWLGAMLYTYRSMTPSLQLFPDALPLLLLLREKGIPTGIVTDGNALVQSNKVRGLGLDSLVAVVVYTDALGNGSAKPDPAGFEIALETLQADPTSSAYVANDLRKDFVAPRLLGMTGVLVTRKAIGDVEKVPFENQPHVVIKDLSEVAELLGTSTNRRRTSADSR